jgi:hypothetical protein
MKKIMMTWATVLCCFISVNAQTENTESRSERYLRLSKEADENPNDWKAQLEIAHILLDKDGGFYNMHRGARYYERIYHLATDFNKEIPDSVIQEAGMMLMAATADKKDVDKSLFYINEMKHAQKVGVDIKDDFLNMCDMYGIIYNMSKEDNLRALMSIMDLRERITKMGQPGVEYTEMMMAVLFDEVIEQGMTMFGDKLLELTMDGKKYIFIAMGDWNIEKPFMGWTNIMGGDKDGKGKKLKLAYGEDGVVYDDLHGSLEYSFFCNKNGVVPQENTNSRLITVTPEQRQQMVEAYHKYLKKAKKNKK